MKTTGSKTEITGHGEHRKYGFSWMLVTEVQCQGKSLTGAPAQGKYNGYNEGYVCVFSHLNETCIMACLSVAHFFEQKLFVLVFRNMLGFCLQLFHSFVYSIHQYF